MQKFVKRFLVLSNQMRKFAKRFLVLYNRECDYVRLVYKPLVLIYATDLLKEKNTVPWLINRLIMAAEHSHTVPSIWVNCSWT